jgi:DNA end-binding protein Ku
VIARAIWQGTLKVQTREVAVKVYSAVQDRQIHFHLLHKRDGTRVEQRMVDAATKRVVPLNETRKAFEAKPGLYIAISSDEIERSLPEPSRVVRINRFVPRSGIDPQLFDRPYYLGPGENAEMDYFALAEAIDAKKSAGIASWVMRKHSYVGALIAQEKYLMLITLRHAEEIVPVSELEPPEGRPLDPKEQNLAEKLIEALSGRFQADVYHDEYQERIRRLVDAKRSGKKLRIKRSPPRRHEGSLADSLRARLKRAPATRSK